MQPLYLSHRLRCPREALTENILNSQDFLQAIYNGHSLTRLKADESELELTLHNDNLELRANLIGYYFSHYYCCVNARARRVEHITWTIKNLQSFSEHMSPFIYVHVVDRASYQAIMDGFEERIHRARLDVDFLGLMASFVERHDQDRAGVIYQSALGLNARLEWLNRRSERFYQNKQVFHEIYKSFKNESDKDYFAYRIPCSGDPKNGIN